MQLKRSWISTTTRAGMLIGEGIPLQPQLPPCLAGPTMTWGKMASDAVHPWIHMPARTIAAGELPGEGRYDVRRRADRLRAATANTCSRDRASLFTTPQLPSVEQPRPRRRTIPVEAGGPISRRRTGCGFDVVWRTSFAARPHHRCRLALTSARRTLNPPLNARGHRVAVSTAGKPTWGPAPDFHQNQVPR